MRKNRIRLMDIDPGNWRLKLEVADAQKQYVASSTTILARAYAYRNARSRAYILYDDDTPIGMGLYHDAPELDTFSANSLLTRGIRAGAMAKKQPDWFLTR